MSNTRTLTPSTINDLVAEKVATTRREAMDQMIEALRHADLDPTTRDMLRVTIKDRLKYSTIPEATHRRRAMECVIEEFNHHVDDGEKMIALFDFVMGDPEQKLFEELFRNMLSYEEMNTYELKANEVGTAVLMSRHYHTRRANTRS